MPSLEQSADALFELSLDLLCVADTDGYFLKLNPAWERVLGWSRKELRSRPYIEFVHPDDRQATRDATEQLADGEDVHGFENRYRTIEGEYRWLRWNARVDREADRVYAAARDVTEEKQAHRTLRRREQQIQEAQKLGRLGYYHLDLRTGEIEGSEVTAKMAGREPGETWTLERFLRSVHPKDRADVEASLREVRRDGEGGALDFRALNGDGEMRWFNSRGVVHEVDGEAVGVTGAIQDITRRKRRERELARLAAVIASSSDAIVGIDLDRVIRMWNPGAEELLGFSEEEIVGEPLSKLVPEDRRDEVDEGLQRLRQGGQIRGLETRRRTKDGDLVDVSSSVFPVRFDGEIIGFTAILRDITERKEREQEMTFQTALLESTIEAIDDGILVVDPDGEIVTYNERFREMWDLSEEVLATRSDEKAISSVLDQLEDPDAFVAKVEELYEHPREASRDEIHLRDGRVFDRFSAPVTGEDGDLYGRVWFFRDITELKDRERELFDLAGELKRSNEVLERFAYVVSHDLREPLRMIRGSVEELAEDHADDLDDEGRKLTGFAREGVQRMERLIDDLLTYSRVDTDAGRMEVVDPERVVSAVLDDLAVPIDESDADVQVGSLPSVVADRTQLRQVLQNLISNAIRFSGDAPPRIRIDGERDGDRAILRVADDGVGIAPGHQDEIFDVFESIPRNGDGEGTGIGLAICDRIVRRHGGEIRVDSAPGEGSTFHVELPAAEADR